MNTTGGQSAQLPAHRPWAFVAARMRFGPSRCRAVARGSGACPSPSARACRLSVLPARSIAALAGTALVAACADRLPDPVPVRPPMVEAPRAVPPPPLARRLSANWSFRDGGEGCFATAYARGAVFRVATSRAGAAMSLQLPPGAPSGRGNGAALRFQGPAGSWTVRARARGHALQSYAPLTEDVAGRVLVLMSGGVLRPVLAGAAWPVIAFPDGGDAGRAWFECVRRGLKG